MSASPLLTFYLHHSLRHRAEAGRHNFINKISEVVTQSGWSVAFSDHDADSLLASAARPGHAMFHMEDPFHDRALTMRKVYEFPFWSIQDSAKRWEWPVARSALQPPQAPRAEVDRFFRYWRNRLFGDGAANPQRNGFVYVPLQGRLLHHRSFQSCTPLEMLGQILAHDKTRRVIATLHPKERYSAEEHAALADLAAKEPRLEIRSADMATLLAGCDYVATQNSSAAFFGYFFSKPAVLFGQVDFHHIASNVAELGVAHALAQAPDQQPDFAAYLYWFWQENAINAGLDSATDKIRARLQLAGWPL